MGESTRTLQLRVAINGNGVYRYQGSTELRLQPASIYTMRIRFIQIIDFIFFRVFWKRAWGSI